ncbi:MAG: hypothetical protein WC548_01595 [Candidatus Pacearchaeota archaeon]
MSGIGIRNMAGGGLVASAGTSCRRRERAEENMKVSMGVGLGGCNVAVQGDACSSESRTKLSARQRYELEYQGPPTEESLKELNIRPDGLYFFSDKFMRFGDGNFPHAVGRELIGRIMEEFKGSPEIFIEGPAIFIGEEQ